MPSIVNKHVIISQKIKIMEFQQFLPPAPRIHIHDEKSQLESGVKLAC
jgi:hypothetical protein